MPLPHIDPAAYAGQLAAKVARFKSDFSPLGLPEPAVFASAPLEYRLRAEFRIWHHDGGLDYAMFDPEAPKRPVLMQDFPAACATIRTAMPALRAAALADAAIGRRLYAVEFLATLSGDLLVTLIYHRRLDGDWEAAARRLAASLGARIIGRSKGQKVVLERDWAEEAFALDGRMLTYRQPEGAFSQPNGGVNRQMLGWARARAAPLGGDLLELYCGNGNFTVALAPLFGRVLATEMSKTSVHAAQHNIAANGTGNVALVRMASDEIAAALAGRETFQRLKDIDLAAHHFTTIFVDPPRSGLDPATLELATRFENILYISCNPQTLRDNITTLQATHCIAAAAAFDQFPYTHHLECGLLLERR
ncbi:MAG: tRNA (uridine(54)-C5)-methyltransferase TrmA [Betaproteobacteria bacterium]|nr:tRNA (uridine(54)-C5)-methyltransferase TrmA [Betaproteobacteria bacterium]